MALDPIQPGGGMPEVRRIAEQAMPGGAAGQAGPASGKEFKQFLLENLSKVNEMQHDADQAVERLALGKETDLTKVMGAVEKADVAFQTLMSVRNKLVESYQEILRMRV